MTQLPTGQMPVEPVVPVEPQPGTAEYNAQVAMTAQANIPAKFRKADGTVDEALLLESYKQLEAMQRGQAPDPTAGVPVPSASDVLDATASSAESNTSATTSAGSVEEILSQEKAPEPTINWEAVRAGTATDADVANIKALGVPEDFIKQFAADRQAAKATAIADVAAAVGGEENLKATLVWARQNKSEAEWNALRTAVAEGGQAKTLLIGLNAEYVASMPKQSGLVVPVDGGVGAGTPSVQPYATKAEMYADMDERDTAGKEIYSYSPVKQRAVALRIFVTEGGDPRNFDAVYRVSTDY